jgi:hypothetical protein
VRKFLILVILLFVPCLAFSQEEDYKKYPGYVDLSDIEQFKESESTMEVFITKPLLSLVAAASSEEDPPLYKLLKGLALIRVENFSVKTKDLKDIKTIMEKVANKLTKDRWSKIVRVREPQEQTEIYIKNEDKQVAGILIMSLDLNKDATFVNIVGNIDMDALGKLSRKFNIPKLDSLTTKKR